MLEVFKEYSRDEELKSVVQKSPKNKILDLDMSMNKNKNYLNESNRKI